MESLSPRRHTPQSQVPVPTGYIGAPIGTNENHGERDRVGCRKRKHKERGLIPPASLLNFAQCWKTTLESMLSLGH